MFIDQWSNIWSIIHPINLLGVCRVEDVCLVSQRRKVFIIGKKHRIYMVIADLLSRLTVKWNEEMFTVISKSFLEPSNLMCSSCRPTLLPRWRSFGHGAYTWLSGQCPGFSQSFPLCCLLEHFCGERPNVYPFPKPSLCHFAVRKTQSSFFSWSLPQWRLLFFPYPVNLRAGRSATSRQLTWNVHIEISVPYTTWLNYPRYLLPIIIIIIINIFIDFKEEGRGKKR